MKRLMCVFIIVLTFLFSFPVYAKAAPQGYKEVKITKKNAKKYFSFKKTKYKDDFGDYSGYDFRLCNKLRKKGYYVYTTKNLALKVTYKERYRIKKQNYTFKDSTIINEFSAPLIWRHDKSYNYKYGKALSIKFNKVKGKVILIKPSNIVKIKTVKNSLGWKYYRIILKNPYDAHTSREEHYDETTGKYVTDYYYIDIDPYEYKFR